MSSEKPLHMENPGSKLNYVGKTEKNKEANQTKTLKLSAYFASFDISNVEK